MRPATDVVVSRYVERDSVLHRRGAAAKLFGVVVLDVSVLLAPTWAGLAITGGLILLAFAVSRVPVSALPRFPAWLWAVLAAGGLLTLGTGDGPVLNLVFHVELGGLLRWVRISLVIAVVLVASQLLGWTTRLADLGPAVHRLLRPFARLGLPAGEIAGAVALAVRFLPLLVSELETVRAGLRMRRRGQDLARLRDSSPTAERRRRRYRTANDVANTVILGAGGGFLGWVLGRQLGVGLGAIVVGALLGVLLAVSGLRTARQVRPRAGPDLKDWVAEAQDVVVVVVLAALRRAKDVGAAVQARGGNAEPVSLLDGSRGRAGDLVLVGVAVVAAVAVQVLALL